MRTLGRIGLWVALAAVLLLTPQLRSPLLLKVRAAWSVFAVLSGAGFLFLGIRRSRAAQTRLQRFGARVMSLGGALCVLCVPYVHLRAVRTQRAVLSAPAPARARLAGHIVAGFRSWDEAQHLVGQVQVAGIYVGLHNAQGLTSEELGQRIRALRELRAAQGLPRLLVAADQEGGPVSRLSPPLPYQPSLASVLAAAPSPAARAELTRTYASAQAAALAPLGVNVDFAPVVDLRLNKERRFLDRYTHIGSRAIDADPHVTADTAVTYGRALAQGGILPTAKHFPGLGRIQTDTHFFPATLHQSRAALEQSDWVPFRAMLTETSALLMLGHVYVADIDPDHLAAGSPRIVRELIRGDWNFDGVLITDDLCMAPAYYAPGGIGGFGARVLAAGVDLLLVSYDGRQIYPVLAALLDAYRTGELSSDVLERSDARLTHLAAALR